MTPSINATAPTSSENFLPKMSSFNSCHLYLTLRSVSWSRPQSPNGCEISLSGPASQRPKPKETTQKSQIFESSTTLYFRKQPLRFQNHQFHLLQARIQRKLWFSLPCSTDYSFPIPQPTHQPINKWTKRAAQAVSLLNITCVKSNSRPSTVSLSSTISSLTSHLCAYTDGQSHHQRTLQLKVL